MLTMSSNPKLTSDASTCPTTTTCSLLSSALCRTNERGVSPVECVHGLAPPWGLIWTEGQNPETLTFGHATGLLSDKSAGLHHQAEETLTARFSKGLLYFALNTVFRGQLARYSVCFYSRISLLVMETSFYHFKVASYVLYSHLHLLLAFIRSEALLPSSARTGLPSERWLSWSESGVGAAHGVQQLVEDLDGCVELELLAVL